MKSAKSTSPFKPLLGPCPSWCYSAHSGLVIVLSCHWLTRGLYDPGCWHPVRSLPPAWMMPGTRPEASYACPQFQAVHATLSAICSRGSRGLLQRIWWGGPPTLCAGRPLLVWRACHIHSLLQAMLSCLPSPSPSHPSARSHPSVPIPVNKA